MKLPDKTQISKNKISEYLLSPRKRNDKSKWLAQAGYNIKNWQVLETDLRKQLLSKLAIPREKTQFGQMYEVCGELFGPNGKRLSVISIWMTELASGVTKFITLFPNKRRSK